MWRKPQLDPTYGETALASYNTLIGLYPTSPLLPAAQKDVAELENWFAIKDYDAGMYYFRRKAWDSAILYFKDALAKYGTTPQALDSGVRLVEAYKVIRYRDDASELCALLKQRYPSDRDVRNTCTGVAPPAVKPDSAPPPPAKPPAF
jgi:outer membrane assembly lipoprotein YfiO